MKTISLSMDQMKHLIELGIDVSDSSLIYKSAYMGSIGSTVSEKTWILQMRNSNDIVHEDDVPAYTLQDILEKLPQVINYKYKNTRRSVPIPMCLRIDGYGDFSPYLRNEHEVVYVSTFNGKGGVGRFSAPDLLDCAYQELCWVKENGYL